jgi:hypothetical protein
VPPPYRNSVFVHNDKLTSKFLFDVRFKKVNWLTGLSQVAQN